jgi:hypothetical protein
MLNIFKLRLKSKLKLVKFLRKNIYYNQILKKKKVHYL